eukprot:4545267-Amphidinium_carterae.1
MKENPTWRELKTQDSNSQPVISFKKAWLQELSKQSCTTMARKRKSTKAEKTENVQTWLTELQLFEHYKDKQQVENHIKKCNQEGQVGEDPYAKCPIYAMFKTKIAAYHLSEEKEFEQDIREI